jgi:hypothetical protein
MCMGERGNAARQKEQGVHHRARAGVRSAALLGLVLLSSACCPEPRAQDARGGGGEAGGGAAVPFSTLQREIFDSRCVTDCHEATNAGAGLILARDRSHGQLVNQRSQQITSRFRVLPGDPAASYLIKKLEGTTDIVGDRMPRGTPRLQPGELAEVRVWIFRGAPND